MKRLILLLAVAVMVFSSCDEKEPRQPEQPGQTEKPEQPEEEPTLIGTWRTTNQYYSLEISPKFIIEALKEYGMAEEMEVSLDVSEVERFEVTFREDGTGYGSGFRYEKEGRHNFQFMWKISEDQLSMYNGSISLGNEYIDHFYWPSLHSRWEIEEFSADKMVWVYSYEGHFDNFDAKEGEPPGWTEDYTFRYTFEKVK
jgi:hypothetical protein